MSCTFFMMPYFNVMSHAFSRSKNTTMTFVSLPKRPTLLKRARLLTEETSCLQHCLPFSLITLQALALLMLKVVIFSVVVCLLNFRSAFLWSFITFLQSVSNKGLTLCVGVVDDLGIFPSAIEISEQLFVKEVMV